MNHIKTLLFALISLSQFSALANMQERYTLCQGIFQSQNFSVKIIANLDSENIPMKLQLDGLKGTSNLMYQGSFQGNFQEYLYKGQNQQNGGNVIEVKIMMNHCSKNIPVLCPAIFTASNVWGETRIEQPAQCQSHVN